MTDRTCVATVAERVEHTATVVGLALRPDRPVGRTPAGSHLDVTVEIAGGHQVRSYSLVDLGKDDGLWRIAVRLDPVGRGGSRWMHALEIGAKINVRGPIDDFSPSPGRLPSVLLAGGIGITPIVSLARAVREAGSEYRVVYTGVKLAAMPFAEHLRREHPGRVALFESGGGTLLDIEAIVSEIPADGVLYVCGPMGLLAAVRAAWQRQRRPPVLLRFETFGTSGAGRASPFVVEVPSRALRVDVPVGTSLLDALEAAGVDVLYDCLRGECGLCRVSILAVNGDLDHRDVFLSERQRAEGRSLCACVSRVNGALTIEC